jgi:flagellum-specific peptidoglycan hydrolase FlgJ
MTPEVFVKTFKADAEKHADKLSPVCTLAQAAWESGWANSCPGNMFFGVKDTDGINGNEQLITTVEYSRRADLKFPVILKVEPTVINGVKLFKYTIKDYFRRYNTPADCFSDHIDFFYKNSRYSEALLHRNDPDRFFDEIAKAEYATDPNYAKNLKSICKTIKKYI